MDRALNLDTLTMALGEHPRLPSPTDLQRLLANIEIGLFTQQAQVGEGLLDAGWYLQSVATARAELQLFPTGRQRIAHQVSAHIFDLALQSVPLEREEQLRYTFAAQIGYLGGDLTPNATALVRRIALPSPPYDWPGLGIASMEAGILLLALNRGELYPLLRERQRQLEQFSQVSGDLSLSGYAAANGVIQGIWDLTNYLTYGRTDALGRAMQWFQAAMASEPAASDVDSRWVAAHLFNIAEALRSSSVWAVLPPNLSPASRAMTLGEPPVLLLWPPQLSFLERSANGVSPLDPSVRRLVLSFPTSAGKSLLAQLFVITQLILTDRDVCVVAPTHSLCRELAGALERRLRTLGQQLYQDGPLGFSNTKPPGARVAVMTPEKLSARLRSNPSALLDEFGMFIVDEAHLIADGERGWRLEETISFLHHLTRDTDHRLLVLSAALGNEVHIVGWLDNGSGVISKHENWRGPRRLNAIYTTEPDWTGSVEQPARGQRQAREVVPLKGVLHLKTPAGSARSIRGEFTEPVGNLVFRRSGGQKVRDLSSSTRQRTLLVPLIVHVAATGPVLIIEATRTEAQRLAEEVFEQAGDGHPAPFALIDVVRSRLGPDHLLTKILAKGVAFHHSALPTDIQAEIEDSVRNGDIRCLVATTTLTEGVNLPFKTVLIAHRGYWGPDGLVQLVDAPRLLNAVGRAGRAGRETEGWLVLFEQRAFEQSMFDELDRTGADVEVRSTLTSETALEALASVEAAAREGQDAILSTQQTIADGFISYVWFVADALEELHGQVTQETIAAAIRDTLAWLQLDDDSRERLLRVTEIAFESFASQPTDRRRRWARTGTSLPSAAALENVSEMVYQDLLVEQNPANIADSLRAVIRDGRLQSLLNLGENKQRGFKARRNAPRDHLVDVDVEGLLTGWLTGEDLQSLASQFLAQIPDADYRYEQLSEFVAGVFEHHLPWMLGIIVGWVNHALEEYGSPRRLPEELPGAVHFGVDSSNALGLMLAGVRSRRLANRIAAIHKRVSPDDQQTLRQWLASQTIAAWRQQFDASPTELLDLLAYVRAPEARLVSEVLAGGAYKLPFIPLVPLSDGEEAGIEPERNQPVPAPLAVMVEGELVGRIGPEHHNDVALLRDIGIPLIAHIRSEGNQTALELRIAQEP